MYFYQGMHSNKKSSILIYNGTVTCLVILKSKSPPPPGTGLPRGGGGIKPSARIKVFFLCLGLKKDMRQP